MGLTVRHAAEALALRRLAISILRHHRGDTAAAWDAARALGPESWRLFLAMERCAPRLAAVAREAHQAPIPILNEFEQLDVRLTLSCRSRLIAAAHVAEGLGIRVAVLKGSVPAAQGEILHLNDVDVLVPEDRCHAFAAALRDQLGARQEGLAAARHLTPLVVDGELAVEVHRTIDTPTNVMTGASWERIVPIPSIPGLWRLAPADQLIHTLTHVVVDHPGRRGRLRDTLVISAALADCSPEDRARARDHIDRHTRRASLLRQLAFAGQFAGGEATDDPFETIAHTNYWLRASPWAVRYQAALGPDEMQSLVGIWLFAQLAGTEEKRGRWSEVADASPDHSAVPAVAFVERRAPRLGRLARVTVRAVSYALTYGIAWILGRAGLRAARRIGAREESANGA